MTNTMLIFIGISILNVVLATIKSIVTIKGSKLSAALLNGIYFGYYNIVMIFTVASDNGLTVLEKVVITALTNFIGVFLVKLVEEMLTKDKLWEVKMTVKSGLTEPLHRDLKALNIPHNYFDISTKHTVFSVYCATQNESKLVKDFVKKYNAKYFVSESKSL